MKNKKYVYMVQIAYSTDDCDGVETYLFDSKEKAIKKFFKQIEFEKQETWVKNAYDNDILSEDYELDTNIEDKDANSLWWNISYHVDFYLHTFIDMREIEVQ